MLNDNCLTDRELGELLQKLESLPKLVMLKLSRNQIGFVTVDALRTLLLKHSPSELEHLEITDVKMKSEVAE